MYRRIPAYPSRDVCRCASRAAICLITSSAVGVSCGIAEQNDVTNKVEIIVKNRNRMLKLQNEFSAELPPGIVVEAAEFGAREICLHIPRVEMVEKIEDARAGSRLEMPRTKANRQRT